MKKLSYVVLLLFIAGNACREPYNPPVVSSNKAFLVIEANLNPNGPTTVSLTRTIGLGANNVIKGENNAQVTVEGKDNTVRTLSPLGNGRYNSPNLGLILGNEYRLRVKTQDGKDYASTYVMARKTPVIDSIGHTLEDEGLRVWANAHDDNNATKYYRWDFDETWEIRSSFFSDLIYDMSLKMIRTRVFPQEDYSVCWKYDQSSTILLANSSRLSDDIIYKAPIQFIPNGSERLSVRYSILLRQYALDREAYNFFELMKKNTEDIGSIFSPQPSEVRGNISNLTDATDYVLGYVTASTVEQRRAFIQIPWTYHEYCPETRVPAIKDSIDYFFGAGGTLIPYTYSSGPPPVYLGSFPNCVDCRTRNGVLGRPSYW